MWGSTDLGQPIPDHDSLNIQKENHWKKGVLEIGIRNAFPRTEEGTVKTKRKNFRTGGLLEDNGGGDSGQGGENSWTKARLNNNVEERDG